MIFRLASYRPLSGALLPAVALLLLAALPPSPARALDGPEGPEGWKTAPRTPAALRAELLYGGQTVAGPESGLAVASAIGGDGARSIPLALGLSAVVPGLGQAYNGQWIKAAAALVLEGVIVVAYRNARRDGLDGEAAYQAYAHSYWSPVQYGSWLNAYADFLGVTATPVDVDGIAVDFADPASWSAAERAAARAFFDQIRAVEGHVYHPETGASFSHKLPYFGEQQYYELIGKYFQFAPGWVDYPTWVTEDGYTVAIDPEHTGPGGGKPNVSPRFWEYDGMMESANNLLRRASRLTAAIVVNHLAAAIDAAVAAKLHNDRLETRVSVAPGVTGRYEPSASITVRLSP